MSKQVYAIGLGSNKRHGRYGSPARILRAALRLLPDHDVKVVAQSPVRHTAAFGPSSRDYANAVALVRTRLDPPALLHTFKAMERSFGRRPGQRWGGRVLDLDIILWSGGIWADRTLAIPHVAFRDRDSVLPMLSGIAPTWRDPVTGFTMRQLAGQLRKSAPKGG